MFIQTETTPNPATIKFLPGQDVSPARSFDFKSEAEAQYAPLAKRLFGIVGVAGVFLGRDFISVTKDDNTDWVMLKSLVMAALMEHLATGQPVLLQEALAGKQADNGAMSDDDDEITAQIKELLETRVRPAVAQDGGDIVFDRFEDGIVYLRMQGACSGCPSSTATLKSGIENMLRHFIPEVEEVRPVPDY
ncbi:MAG: NifU family protein [Alphaproteobacteria bacterium]|nr:NifU family protein [Alphaproteobacteria bacterium]MCD8571304.1 NifU family protein [Alphaproteobacteria bacterium]